MQVILLERIAKLGQMGDEVHVKDGYARNYLLPQGKALRANEANRQRFENERAQLEARNLERRKEADSVAEKINGRSFVVIRQAGETGQLYGSVTNRDLMEIMEEEGLSVARSQIGLTQPIKSIGMHEVAINLLADVVASVTVNIARTEDEAERQARGEDPLALDEDEAEADDETAEGEDSDGGDSEGAEAAEASADAETADDEGEADASADAEADSDDEPKTDG